MSNGHSIDVRILAAGLDTDAEDTAGAASSALSSPSASSWSEDESDDDDDDDDDVTCFEVFCCCWGPRCCVGSCMLIMTLMGWSAAITYGIFRQPSYDDLVVPIRLAKQRWFNAKPTNAEDGFILFDRNADGKISVADMATVARITTGEDPTHEQLDPVASTAMVHNVSFTPLEEMVRSDI